VRRREVEDVVGRLLEPVRQDPGGRRGGGGADSEEDSRDRCDGSTTHPASCATCLDAAVAAGPEVT
jgi:hypothetical protein